MSTISFSAACGDSVPDFPNVDRHGTAAALTILGGVPWYLYLKQRILFSVGATPTRFGAETRLGQFKFLYFANLALFKKFPYLGPPQQREEHQNYWMLFCGDFDGGIREYVERYLDGVPDVMDNLFGMIPGYIPCDPLEDEWIENLFLHGLQCPTYYSAYPDATVNDISHARALQNELVRFIENSLRTSPSEFTRAYDEFLRQVARRLGRRQVRSIAGDSIDAGTSPEDERPKRMRRTPLRTLVEHSNFDRWMSWIRTTFVGNRAGHHSVAMMLCPIRPGQLVAWESQPASTDNGTTPSLVHPTPEESLLDALKIISADGMPYSDRVHVARIGVMTSKFFDIALRGRPRIIADVPEPKSEPRTREPNGLRSSYLLFEVVYDGDLAAFARDLTRSSPQLDTLWRYCVAYPGMSDPAALVTWMQRCMVANQIGYTPFPDLTVPEVRRALEVRSEFTRFATAAASAGWRDETLRTGFDELVARLSGVSGEAEHEP